MVEIFKKFSRAGDVLRCGGFRQAYADESTKMFPAVATGIAQMLTSSFGIASASGAEADTDALFDMVTAINGVMQTESETTAGYVQGYIYSCAGEDFADGVQAEYFLQYVRGIECRFGYTIQGRVAQPH